MKQLLVFFGLSLMTTFSSCKKDPGENPCMPSHTPCPVKPTPLDITATSQGVQARTYVYDVFIPIRYLSDEEIGFVRVQLNGQYFNDYGPFLYSDSVIIHFTFAFPDNLPDSFTISAGGFDKPFPCYCDSSSVSISKTFVGLTPSFQSRGMRPATTEKFTFTILKSEIIKKE